MGNEMRPFWLLAEMVFGSGSPKIHELLRHFDNVREMYYSLHDPDCGLLNERERQSLRHATKRRAEEVIAYCEKNGIGIMTIDDEFYPNPLRYIYNPPCVLFYRGDITLLQERVILTVVGARRASEYSLHVTDEICGEIARNNVVLASGCAVGIDATAHRAAVRAGTPTIGVLGCGVDVDYPRENWELKEQIVENGLLLSEYFPGTQPKPTYFPVRNRILSGISEAVLVVEAGNRSGSLITANLACEQGRQVFCVPPANIFDSRYDGVKGLLRDGAYPAFDAMDILYSLYLKYPYQLPIFDEDEISRTVDSLVFAMEEEERQEAAAAAKAAPAETAPPLARAPQAPPVPPKPREEEPPQRSPYVMPAEASDLQRRILALIKSGIGGINVLCGAMQMDFAEMSDILMEMDLQGWITSTGHDTYRIAEDTDA